MLNQLTAMLVATFYVYNQPDYLLRWVPLPANNFGEKITMIQYVTVDYPGSN